MTKILKFTPVKQSLYASEQEVIVTIDELGFHTVKALKDANGRILKTKLIRLFKKTEKFSNKKVTSFSALVC